MDYLENTTSVDNPTLVSSYLAKFSFLIYLFFMFFGTYMPFREEVIDPTDIVTSNPVNQFVLSFLYLISFIALVPKRHLAFQLIRNEKFLTLFLLWSLLGVFWSDVPLVSLKRWIQILGMVIILLSVLLHFKSADESLTYFRAILITYIPISYLSILFIPAAIDWTFPAWRGIAPHKNWLGQVSLISLIIWSYAEDVASRKKKMIHMTFWILSLILLLGSKSYTGILTGIIVLFLAGTLYAEKTVFTPVIGRFFSFIFFSSLYAALSLLIYLASDLLTPLFFLIGKDPTLSGRLDLWASVFEETKKHLLLGSGFGGFWVANSTLMDAFFEEYLWLPNEAHMGYLDIMNETGLIGISIFTLMAYFYFAGLYKHDKPQFWKWLVFAALIGNFSESSLFRPNHLSGVLFIFSYLALYVDILKTQAVSFEHLQPSANSFTSRYFKRSL